MIFLSIEQKIHMVLFNFSKEKSFSNFFFGNRIMRERGTSFIARNLVQIPFTTACCAYGLLCSVFFLCSIRFYCIFIILASLPLVVSWVKLIQETKTNQGVIFCSTAGVEVTCSCRSGFAGDGFTCKGNIIQVRNTLQFFFLRELCMTLGLLVLVGGLSRSVSVLFLVCNVLESKKKS